VTQEDLEGRFWVADFIFTRCTGVCPTLTARMASLSRQLADAPDIRLVSFSVDPDYDTPEVLRGYPGRVADARWLFLTGDAAEIYRLVGEGFRLNVAAGGPPGAGSGELVTHSDRFVIVDPDLNIRGYYHGADEEEVGRLATDLRALMRERDGR
jgi:cytochrome oxidase Cu insertion factor (SCO1/SenC/PrrC family)